MDKTAVRRWRRDVFRILEKMGWRPEQMSPATVLAAIDAIGTDVTALTELTGLSNAFVTRVLRRLRKSKLLIGTTLRIGWDDDHAGYVALVCDTLVADGSVVRVPDDKRSAAAKVSAAKRTVATSRRKRAVLAPGAVFTPKRVKSNPLYLATKEK